jgi:hypothetical protein
VVFSKIARLFEGIFKVVEVLFRNVEAFIKMWSFLKIYSEKLRLFKLM